LKLIWASLLHSGIFDAVTLVHSYDSEKSVEHQKTKLSALNVITRTFTHLFVLPLYFVAVF
jgi:hypothetical protein